MTVQREDIEPENARARAGPSTAAVGSAPDWRTDPGFRWPERVPWSQVSPEFIAHWAPPTGNNREHLEIVGPSGSGKTHLLLTMLQDHYRSEEQFRADNDGKRIGTGAILLVTKQDDDVFRKLGWPVVHNADEVKDITNVVMWPRTRKTGTARREYHEARIRPLLERLWQPRANRILAFDEVGYVESLSGEIRADVQMYWREARSMGIQVVGMKQRPQGALRDMHSETFWTVVFRPKDRSDAERFAELLGHRRDWVPVLDDLSLDRHEFVVRHSRSDGAYISWVDTPLRPQKIRRRGEVGGYPR